MSFEKSMALADSEAEKSVVERLPLQMWQLAGVRYHSNETVVLHWLSISHRSFSNRR